MTCYFARIEVLLIARSIGTSKATIASAPRLSGNSGALKAGVQLSWPLISPPGNVASCMFAYAKPPRRADANAAGVSVLRVVVVPLNEPAVAAGTAVNGTTTPTETPGGAGAWMWAAVAGAVRPVKVSDQVDVEVV